MNENMIIELFRIPINIVEA